MENTGGTTFCRSIAAAAVIVLPLALLLIVNSAAAHASWPPPDAAATETDTYVYYDFTVITRGYEALPGGGQVRVRVYRPRGGGPFPAAALVPAPMRAPIVADSERWSRDVGREMDTAVFLAGRGIATILYNPPGRGIGEFASGGSGDQDGYTDQDALAQVLRAARDIPFIDGNNIGLCSDGAGLAAAAGALARNPDLAVRYLIDVEGPFDNLDMSGYTWTGITPELAKKHMVRESLYYKHWATAVDASPENVDWWQRREPGGFMHQINVTYYQRVQFETDRFQPPGYYAHALRMYEAALAAKIPHARIDRNPWNAPLPPRRVPDLMPGRFEQYNHAVEDYIIELANLKD
jgi:hypothetical protein